LDNNIVQILPAAFLVRRRHPIPRIDKLPRSGARLLDLPADARLSFPASLDRDVNFLDLRAAWNPQGLAFQLAVAGRTAPVMSDPADPSRPDSLHLWIDTRDTQTVHRATRYCHCFAALPVGEGPKGLDALVVQQPVGRAREDAPISDSEAFLARSRITKDGYELEVWLPAETLYGYAPESQPRLGFTCQVKDAEHGEAAFAAGNEFPVASDPSLWHSLELAT
jgi:hypothetical protein